SIRSRRFVLARATSCLPCVPDTVFGAPLSIGVPRGIRAAIRRGHGPQRRPPRSDEPDPSEPPIARSAPNFVLRAARCARVLARNVPGRREEGQSGARPDRPLPPARRGVIFVPLSRHSRPEAPEPVNTALVYALVAAGANLVGGLVITTASP